VPYLRPGAAQDVAAAAQHVGRRGLQLHWIRGSGAHRAGLLQKFPIERVPFIKKVTPRAPTKWDDDDLYLFLQKQQPAHRYIPIGYVPPGIKESTCDDAAIMSLMVL